MVYHDFYWYRRHLHRVNEMLAGPWGRLFNNWDQVALPPDDLTTPGFADVGQEPARLNARTMKLLSKGIRILGTAMKEAPEFNPPRAPSRT